LSAIINDRDVLLQATSPRVGILPSDAAITALQLALTNIASDNILSPSEKPVVVKDYDVITGEQAGIVAQANLYGVSHASYDTNISSLTTYLGTLTGWNTIPGSDVAITGTVFRAYFENVYSARQIVLNAITAQANYLANNVGTGQIVPSAVTDVAAATVTNITASRNPNAPTAVVSVNYTAAVACTVVLTATHQSHELQTAGAGGVTVIQPYQSGINTSVTLPSGPSQTYSIGGSAVAEVSYTMSATQNATFYFVASGGNIAAAGGTSTNWVFDTATIKLEAIKK
jgi:hypothetical protein